MLPCVLLNDDLGAHHAGGAAVRIDLLIVLQPTLPSQAAAEIAMAAQAQGKFWPMHRAMFALEAGDYDKETLRKIAGGVGLNIKRLDQEMSANTYAKTLNTFLKRFMDAGLDGPPAFFVNGRGFALDPRFYSLRTRLQMELDRAATERK